MIDAWTLAQLPKDNPLTIRSHPAGFTCAICGCVHEPHSWRVMLPGRAGVASPECAADAGFTFVNYPRSA